MDGKKTQVAMDESLLDSSSDLKSNNETDYMNHTVNMEKNNKAFIGLTANNKFEKMPSESLCTDHNYSSSSITTKNTEEAITKDDNNATTHNDTASNSSEILNSIVSEEIDSVNDGFVSSMIEVVNSVEVEECFEATASSDSDSSDDSDSDSSSSSSDTTSLDDSCSFRIRHEDIELEEEIAALKDTNPPRVKGEILNDELPPVEDINISLPEESVLESIGKVWQIMKDHSVVVKSFEDKPALDFKTILFFAKDLAFGLVDETFGPVSSPYYVIRFNSEEQRISKGVELEREVFYAPHIKDFTSFVFVSELKKIRGSDASWSNDREPPPSCIEYSDDEQERDARKKRKNQANKSQTDNTETNSSGSMRGRGKGRKHEQWHNESTRVNVISSADASQLGWQNAVNGRRNQGSLSPQPPTVFNCFQPLPPYAAFAGGPFGPPAPPPFNQPFRSPQGNCEQQAHFMNWNSQGSFSNPPPNFGFGRPCPPPPPPPPPPP